LKSDADLKIAFESGANQITGGSIAKKNRAIFENGLPNMVLIKSFLEQMQITKSSRFQDGWKRI
jgi:hypothetical protein